MPVLNEEVRLERALESIFSQDYPKEKIEVVIADGGSSDRTLEIAKRFGCLVVGNPARKAEPGVERGFAVATGDVWVILAADNPLYDPGFLSALTEPFSDPSIGAVVPQVVSTSEDGLTARYLNLFSDPVNHFIYGAATAPITFKHAYKVLDRTQSYVIYDFASGPMPLIGLAQWVAVRKGFARPPGTELDDLAPVEALIDSGLKVAYAPNARIEHHSVAGIADFTRKFGPRISTRLAQKSEPIWARSRTWSRLRRARALIWPFYSVLVLPGLAQACYGYLRDSRLEWFYHPVVSLVLGIEFWRRFSIHYVGVVLRKMLHS